MKIVIMILSIIRKTFYLETIQADIKPISRNHRRDIAPGTRASPGTGALPIIIIIIKLLLFIKCLILSCDLNHGCR